MNMPFITFRKWLSAGVALAAMLLAPGLWAASADRSLPIEIEADAKTTDYQAGIGVYTGNVVIVQGSLHATGDKATIYVIEGGLHRAVLEGRPATFRELDDEGEEIKGEARHAEYLARDQRIVLTGAARIDRGGDILSSEVIDYDMAAEVVKASGQQEGDRVRLILMPRGANGE